MQIFVHSSSGRTTYIVIKFMSNVTNKTTSNFENRVLENPIGASIQGLVKPQKQRTEIVETEAPPQSQDLLFQFLKKTFDYKLSVE